MKKLDIVNAIREIVANEDNRKYKGYNVVAYFVHGMGNDNIRSASTISAEYKKEELQDALNYFNETVNQHGIEEEPMDLGLERLPLTDCIEDEFHFESDLEDPEEDNIVTDIHPLDSAEKVHTIATFNYNGISVVLIHNEGTNQIGHDEHYAVYMQSEHQAMQMQYLYLAQALGKFDECRTHALNWSVKDYQNEWFRTMKGGR